MQKHVRNTTQKSAPSKKGTKARNINVRTVSKPIAKAVVRRTTEPVFRPCAPGCILVSKTEYIGEIVSSSENLGYEITLALPINVGAPQTFPWASTLAKNFESYRFKSLSFHFETEAPTTQIGYVGLVIDYNPSEPAPISKVQAMDFEESIRGPVWENFSHRCLSKNLSKRKTYFCRSANDVVTDPLLYDVGNVYVIQGNTGSSPVHLGELWVEYELELMTPELNPDAITFDGAVLYPSVQMDNSTHAGAQGFTVTPGVQVTYNSSGVITNQQIFVPDQVEFLPTIQSENHDVANLPLSVPANTWITPIDGYTTGSSSAILGSVFSLSYNTTYIWEAVVSSGSGTAFISQLDLDVSYENATVGVSLLNISRQGTSGQAVRTFAQFNVTVGDGDGSGLLPVAWLTISGTISLSSAISLVSKCYVRAFSGPSTGIVPTLRLAKDSKVLRDVHLGFKGTALSTYSDAEPRDSVDAVRHIGDLPSQSQENASPDEATLGRVGLTTVRHPDGSCSCRLSSCRFKHLR